MSKIFTYPILFILFSLSFSCQFSEKKDLLFDVSELSNNSSPKEVIKIVKTSPDSSFDKSILGRERYIQLYYGLDSGEFRFAKNKLIEVIIHKPKSPFKAETITQFGLPFKEPSESDSTAFIKWARVYQNFPVVNFYLVGSRKDERKTRYKIYFKTN